MRSKKILCGSVIAILSGALIVCAVPNLKDRILGPAATNAKAQPKQTTPSQSDATRLTEREVKSAVMATMAAFAQSVAQKSMAPFYRQISPFWQARSSVRQLDEKFAPFLRAGVDLRPLARIEPVITWITPVKGQKTLRVAGYYPTRPMRVEFDMILRPEKEGGFKAVAFFVALKPASTPKAEPKKN